MVDIAFITVNYNTLNYLRQLSSFFETLDVPLTFSFTVVDNNSADGSQEFLKSRPGVHYIQAGENLGYGRAVNRAVGVTASKYVGVTNTDVVLNRDALVRLWTFLEEHADAGVCAPRITYEDGRDQGMVFKPSLISHYANWFAKLAARRAKLQVAKANGPLQVDGVMGAFFIIRRSAIPCATLFDEDFFFFYEDTSLAHTLKNCGVKCFVVPDVSIIHVGGQSRSASSVALFYNGKYLYLKKFYGPIHARCIYLLDRARISYKLAVYSILAWFSSSDRVRSKQSHYRHARSNTRFPR
jgi:N-acetylglucosaminyl-diphospho-decaprenol L-rhamnosyltransferase